MARAVPRPRAWEVLKAPGEAPLDPDRCIPRCMIVQPGPDSLHLFRQVDHAAACGEFAAAWDPDRFGTVPGPVRVAAAAHDDGWTEWDHRPRLKARSGRPHTYASMPPDDYRVIWERGVARGWARGPEVGLLVSLHGMRFFESREDPRDRALLQGERGRQRRALERLGSPARAPAEPPRPWGFWHEWIFFWDALSLFLCGEFGSEMERTLPDGDGRPFEVTVRRREREDVRLDPFPFRAPVQVRLPYRLLDRDDFSDQAALDEAVAAARTDALRVDLAPA